MNKAITQTLAFRTAIALYFSLTLESCCPQPQMSYEWTANINGEQRRALIWKPNNSCNKAPVVVYLHGRGGNAEDSQDKRKFHELWKSAFVVYAEGSNFDGNANGAKGWECRFPHIYTSCNLKKDVNYIKALFDHLSIHDQIDPTRFFICGHSSGGFFTLALSSLMAQHFRAFAALGCYSSFGPVTPNCGNTYADGMNLQDLQNTQIVFNPAPVLYIFGDLENTIKPNQQAFQPDCSTFSYCQNTVIQLCLKNGSELPDCPVTGYMNIFQRQVFPPAVPGATETQFQLYHGGHGWPDAANQWVIDYFKSF